jgi:hypothetical protein
MEPWLVAESRIRRDDVLKNAARSRPMRGVKGRQSSRVRMRIAAGAQIVSDALAVLARRLRNGEAA